MFRKLIGGLTSTAVVAGLATAGMVTAGIVATATPAAANTPTSPFTVNPYNQSLGNPTLTGQCGLDFGLVLDSSGSIGGTGIANLKTAANAFVDSLVDTGSTVAVTSFSTTSPGSGGTNLAPTPLTTANLATIKGSYSGLSSDGWTNWQDGLLKMNNFYSGSWNPDLMIVITDGNPNTVNPAGSGGNAQPDGSTAAVNPAIAQANTMKGKLTKMFGIAVGSNITLDPIRAITNTTAYNSGPPTNFSNAGYTTSTNYATLKADLEQIAADLCGSTVKITKKIDTPDTDGFVNADATNKWTFDTTVTIPDAAGNWVNPNTAPTAITKNVASTRSVQTDGSGVATFQWKPKGKWNTNPVVVKETLQSGWERNATLVCTTTPLGGSPSAPFNVTADANGNWNIGQTTPGDTVACEAKNTLTKLNLEKVVSDGSATPSQFQLKATPLNAPNAPSYDRAGNYTTFDPIAGGVTYQLSETGPANYSRDGSWQCTNGVTANAQDQIVVPAGKQTRCTINNSRDLAKLAVVKEVKSGTALPADFKLSAKGTPSDKDIVDRAGNVTTLATVYSGINYTLSETGPANYSQTGDWKCVDKDLKPVTVTGGNTVKLDKNAEVTCTVTNDRDLAKLAVVKEVKSGTALPADFKLSAKGTPSDKDIVDRAGNVTTLATVYSGINYTLSETGPANYSQTGDWKCVDKDLKPVTVTGGNTVKLDKNAEVTCTVTNDRDLAKLAVVKEVKSGTALPADFKLSAKGTPSDKDIVDRAGNVTTLATVYSGINYTLSETGPANYSQTGDWKCVDKDLKPVTVTGGNTVKLDKNAEVTCTVTNDRDLAKLAVVKEVKSGTALPADFKLSAKGTPSDKDIVDRAGNVTTLATVYSGINYTLSETGPANYSQTGDWKCVDKDLKPVTVTGGNTVKLDKNAEVTCTVTNDRDLAKLAVVKEVKSGTALPADFKLSAKGTPSDKDIVDRAGNVTTLATVYSGINYTLSETGPANYSQTGDWKCVDKDLKPVTVTGGNTVKLDKNAEVTCTVTNDRDLAKLAVVKEVKSGTALPADFKLSAKGTPSDKDIVDRAGNVTTLATVYSGINYTLSETGPANYSQTGDWKCVDKDLKPVTVTGGNTVKLDKNAEVTCTVTNDRDVAELKLLKKVTGDNGAKAPGDWNLTATAAIPNDGKNFTVKGDADTYNSVFAGTQYTLTETGPGDYTPSDWTCKDADGTVTVIDGNKVTVPNGKRVTCEITNDRNTAELRLVKKVTGDNGAKGADDWTLKADAAAPLDNKNFSNLGGQGTFKSVYSGTDYTLSETGPGDYTASDWVCKTETNVPVSVTDGKVKVGKDTKVTCEITNDRDTAELKLVKKVTGDNNAKGPNDWTLAADATAPLDNKNFSNLGGQGTFKSVYSGTDYTLSETGPGDYTASDWVCKDEQGASVSSTGGKVNLKKGDKVTCEITNDRNTAELKLVKKVDGGNQLPDDWTLSADAAAPLNDKNFSNLGGQGTFKSVYSATEYTLSETGPGDYSPSDWVCKDEQGASVSSTGGKVNLKKGDKVTCELTNKRDLGELKLVKKVTGDNNAKTPGDWDLSADAAAPLDLYNFTVKGDADTFKTVYSNTAYALTESGPGDYTASDWKCENGQGDPVTVTNGEVKVGKGAKVTCEITNDRNTAELKLVKLVEGGSSVANDWTLTAKADAPLNNKNISTPGGSGVFETVYSGVDYTLAETGPGNYTADTWQCVSDRDDKAATQMVQEGDVVNLAKGEKVTCTIVNVRDTAELKLVKQVEGKNNPNDWTLTAKAGAPDDGLNISTPGGSGQFESVYAGTQYTLAETGPGGYSPSDWVCLTSDEQPVPEAVDGQLNDGDKITLKKGQRVTCTIINTRDLGSLTITKEFNPQQSGYTGTFDINYTCVDGADPVKNGTVQLAAGQSTTITGLPTGTTCTVTEPNLPANPTGWTFNPPTFSPANGQATVTTKDQTVSVTVVNSVAQVSPVVVKKICPIDVTLNKPVPKKVGNKILTKKIKTNKSSCVLLKPVVLCRPLASTTAGETAFCDTKVTKKGRITVKTKGYEKVRVTVIVRAKPKPGFEDRWKPNTWRKSWILR